MSKLKPGRELDALVAEKVMECKLIDQEPYKLAYGISTPATKACGCNPVKHNGEEFYLMGIKNYSTDITAAWEVVERFHSRCNDRAIEITMYSGQNALGKTWANNKGYKVEFIDGLDGPPHVTHSNSLPHAICLAALKAVSYKVE